MNRNQSSIAPALVQYIHEATFSLNLALTLMAFFFLFNPRPLTSRLFRMDVAINRSLHILNTADIPKDYFTLGYFAFFLPAMGLALCLWALLRLFSRASLTEDILKAFGGIAAFAALPIYWLFAEYSASHRYGWNPLRAIQFYELVVVLICVSLYLRRNWPVPWWGNILIALLHYGFWSWQFGTYYILVGNGGPIIFLPLIGVVSALAWVLYIRHSRMAAP